MSQTNNELKKPVAESVNDSLAIDGLPEIVNINYDLWYLTVTLEFPNRDTPIYVRAEEVIGFRVLDEGNLLEFWNPESRPDGWMWKIISGGWFELESTRKGFISGYDKEYSEYLILGADDCINIITNIEPKINVPSVP